jgi:hypothetical protein
MADVMMCSKIQHEILPLPVYPYRYVHEQTELEEKMRKEQSKPRDPEALNADRTESLQTHLPNISETPRARLIGSDDDIRSFLGSLWWCDLQSSEEAWHNSTFLQHKRN